MNRWVDMESQGMALMEPALLKCKPNAEEKEDDENDADDPEGGSRRFHERGRESYFCSVPLPDAFPKVVCISCSCETIRECTACGCGISGKLGSSLRLRRMEP